MTNSPILEVLLSNKNYCKTATNLFQKYACANFEDLSLLEAFQIDFEH